MKSKKLLLTMLSLTVMSSTLMSACGSKKESATTIETNNKIEDENHKDKVQELTFASVPGVQVNPGVTTRDNEWVPEGYIYEGIVRNFKTSEGFEKVVPGVAEKWEVSNDGLTYTFYVRDNAKWADGKPVTAEDFVYSWRRLVDPKSHCVKNGKLLNDVVKNATAIQKGEKSPEELGVKADGNKFVVTLEKPCLYFLEYCFHPNLKPVRKDYVEKYGIEMGKTVDSIMGNGAYKCTLYEEKSKMVFEKSQTYWNKDTRYINKITFNKIEDENSKLSALEAMQIDRTAFGESDVIERVKDIEHVISANEPGKNTDFLMFNCKNEYLANTNIRKAIASGFSRENYVDSIVNNLGRPAYGLVPPVIACAGNKYTPGDLKSEISKMNSKELLKKGLQELGKSDDPSQIQLRIAIGGTQQKDKDTADFFIEELKNNLGIVIKADLMDSTIYFDKVGKGDYEIGIGGWFADWNDPSNFLDTFVTGGYYATDAKYSNKDYDEYMKKSHEQIDANKAAEYYAKAERILCVEDPAIAALVFNDDTAFTWDYVKNYARPSFGFEDFQGVYISGKEALK
ncbi:oligopeptide transport system substrate-binding protein [Hathewaya proteolytica DSM 3090]|uniref:Oligopeptide transport system substrate-binding protein n=1 Tax=Hathewaya proteolytica DSM 3090 TaxID=1121331 RepID=A0A1M6QRG7_9CLOT|nr:peptide ABC transporter substrate-binding protein [Hathewaya proteolytica]SHK22775.1 oligopeptide transport system substrate-binding protein [Hathewaya proteolytica DSM 3090]